MHEGWATDQPEDDLWSQIQEGMDWQIPNPQGQ